MIFSAVRQPFRARYSGEKHQANPQAIRPRVRPMTPLPARQLSNDLALGDDRRPLLNTARQAFPRCLSFAQCLLFYSATSAGGEACRTASRSAGAGPMVVRRIYQPPSLGEVLPIGRLCRGFLEAAQIVYSGFHSSWLRGSWLWGVALLQRPQGLGSLVRERVATHCPGA